MRSNLCRLCACKLSVVIRQNAVPKEGAIKSHRHKHTKQPCAAVFWCRRRDEMFPPLYAHLSWDRTGMGKCNPARKKIEKYMIGLGHTWLQIRRCVTRFPWKYVHNICNWRKEGERAMQRKQRAREHGGTRPSVWLSAPAVLSFSANSFAASCQRKCVHVWCWRYVGIQTVYTCVCRAVKLFSQMKRCCRDRTTAGSFPIRIHNVPWPGALPPKNEEIALLIPRTLIIFSVLLTKLNIN